MKPGPQPIKRSGEGGNGPPAAPEPTALFAERAHPLVRFEWKYKKRSWLLTLLALAGAPYALFAFALGLVLVPILSDRITEHDFPKVLGGVCCFVSSIWPLTCVVGGAAIAAERVAEDRKRGTAEQLVLTPLSPAVLAAAKVLPAFGVCFWALLLMLPFYVGAASSGMYALHGTVPTLSLLTPLRTVATVVGLFALDQDPTPVLPLAHSFFCGLLMCAGDVVLTWATVHLGAAWAVRHRGTTLGAGAAIARVCAVLLAVGVALGVLEALVVISGRHAGAAGPMLLIMLVLLPLVILGGGRFLARHGTRLALAEFARLDQVLVESGSATPCR